MADQELLDQWAKTLADFETESAIYVDGELIVKHTYRIPEEMQERTTYHRLKSDDEGCIEENIVPLGVFGRAKKNGIKLK